MLERMRAATQGVVGRAIMTIVLGLIVVSFAVWGIGDVFRGFGGNKIASVGGATITPDEFRNAYQTLMQQYQRQAKAGLTNAQAHAMGLDVQTLGRLIADKALDVQAQSLGLALSDDAIADAVRDDPSMKDASGAFNRDRFEQVLRDMGLSERGFIVEQRKTDLRQQLGVALANGLTAPKGADGGARALRYAEPQYRLSRPAAERGRRDRRADAGGVAKLSTTTARKAIARPNIARSISLSVTPTTLGQAGRGHGRRRARALRKGQRRRDSARPKNASCSKFCSRRTRKPTRRSPRSRPARASTRSPRPII